MSDVNDGAAGAGATGAAPSTETNSAAADVSTPNPVSTEREPAPAKTEEPKAPASAREALKRASEKVEAAAAKSDAKDKGEKDEPTRAPKEVKSEGQPRGEHGHFAGKEGDKGKAEPNKAEPGDKSADPQAKPATNSGDDAPSRFKPEAKTHWANTHEVVRGEVHRAISELETGLQKYKTGHDEYEQVRDFAESAKKNGYTLRSAIEQYAILDQMVRTDPVNAFREICDARGFSFRKIAEAFLGMEPNEAAARSDQTIAELRREIADLKSGVGELKGEAKKQHDQALLDRVNEFMAKNPRFEELSDIIEKEIGHGYSLEEAYDRAARLNPAPNPAPATTPAPVVPTAAQTGKGEKSISGAPSAGSNPVSRQSSPSIREAIKRATARAG